MTMTLKRSLSLVLVSVLTVNGCAARSGNGVRTSPTFGPDDTAVLAEYAQKLPLGSRIRVERNTSRAVSGTLIKTTSTQLVVQRNTRLPERPVEIAFSDVTRITIEPEGTSFGKAVAIGAAVGAGAVLAFILVLAAAFND